MPVVLLLLAAIVLFALIGVVKHAGRRLRQHGIHALAWRWLTAGGNWTGKPVTNRGWTRAGTRALTPTGHAHRRWHLPRWQHALWRVQWTLVMLLTCAGLLFQTRRTLSYLGITALAGAGYGFWRGRERMREHGHRKNYVKPLHARLATAAGIPLAMKPESWLEIPRDLSYAVMTWPKGAELPKPQERQAIESTAASTLGMRGAKPKWQYTGPHLKLRLVPPVPPPRWVYLDDIDWAGTGLPDLRRDAIRQAILEADPDTLVLGVGQDGKVVTVSLKQDSPHMALSVDTGKGKALALATRVPTPGGWTTMGEVRAGDLVFDETGTPCRVTNAWDVRYGRPCYEVEFSDGSVIVADAEHQWFTETVASRRVSCPGFLASGHARREPGVVTTEEIAATLRRGGRYNHSMTVTGPLKCPEADLPVPPYTMGAWLGDGSSWRAEITTADPEVITEIEAEGESARSKPSSVKERHATYSIRGLAPRLRSAGLFPDGAGKRADKHIPVIYLRASEDQRRALLAGLLDTDGTCSEVGQVEFVSTRERLAYDMFHLVAGLGYKVGICRETARLYGKDCGPKWRVRFTPDGKVFRLSRKASRQVVTTRPTARRRYVVDVRPVPSVPVRCIAVDSPNHLFLVGDTCIPTHNSVLVRCLVAQVLMRGGIAAVLDNKLVSHPSLRSLPNVAYADDIDKIHDFLEWLDGELTRRAEFIRAHTDFLGNLTGSPGPRLVVIMEEQNLMMNRLRSYWAERQAEDKALPKDEREHLPATSPAIRGFANASYVGRELKVHLVFIAQRFTAEAAGGGSQGAAVRMNTGIRILAGYDDDTWKMLVGKQTPMPPPSKHGGRMQVYIKGGDLTEVQVAFFTHAETRQFAESGTARVPAKLRHLTEFRPSGAADPRPADLTVTGGGDGSAVVVTPVPALQAPPVKNWMTIRQAREQGLLPRTWTTNGAFRTAKSRAKKDGIPVPEVKAMKGSEAMYDAIELADFLEQITT